MQEINQQARTLCLFQHCEHESVTSLHRCRPTWSLTASMSFSREQEETIFAHKLNMLGRHLFEKKETSWAPLLYLPIITTPSTLETICSLTKVEEIGIAVSPADAYVYSDSLIQLVAPSKWVRVDVIPNVKFSYLRRWFLNESQCILYECMPMLNMVLSNSVYCRGCWYTSGIMYMLQQLHQCFGPVRWNTAPCRLSSHHQTLVFVWNQELNLWGKSWAYTCDQTEPYPVCIYIWGKHLSSHSLHSWLFAHAKWKAINMDSNKYLIVVNKIIWSRILITWQHQLQQADCHLFQFTVTQI